MVKVKINMKNGNSTIKDLTIGSPLKLIVSFALPLILGNLLQQLYNFVDTMIVGHFLGVEALAGVGATGSINFLILGFCLGVSGGFAIPVAQMFGAKDERRLRKFFANSIYLSLGISIVLAVLVSIFCRNILEIMKTPSDVIDYSYVYILTIFIGIPITFFYNLLAGVIRSVGDSKTPLIFLMISTLINVVLDYVFISPFGWGIFGAAFATVLSQLISGVLCLRVIIKRFPILHISKDEWAPDGGLMKILCGMGLPMGFQYSITAIGSVILQTSVNTLGSLAVAAMTAANKVNMIFISIIDSLGASMATYGGQNLGAGKIDRIKKGTLTASVLGIGYSVVAFCVMLIVGKPLASLFIDSPHPQMLEMASLQILTNSAAFIFLVFVNVLRFLIQGVGFSTFAILAGVLEMIARAIGGLWLVPKFGYIGACFSSPLAWVMADAFLIPAYIYVVKKLEKRIS